MNILPQPPSDEDAEWLTEQYEQVMYEAVREREMHPWTAAMATMAFAKEFRMQAIFNSGIVGDVPFSEANDD